MNRVLPIVMLALLAGAACSRKDEGAPPATQSPAHGSAPPPAARAEAAAPTEPAPPPAIFPDATLTDVNVAAADMGGEVEELTGNYDPAYPNYGPGLTGRRLIDGLAQPTWFAPADWNPNRMFNKAWGWAAFPADAVFSFYERKPALVGAITIVVPEVMAFELQGDTSAAPKKIEVWMSMDDVPGHFTRAADATVETTPGEHTVTFPAREARYVRLRVLSGASPRVLEIAEVKVLESAREGYVPLFDREPGTKLWKGSPREAAQRGLDWLQQSAIDWAPPNDNGCFGCHVQAQALMGQAVALEKGYRVSRPAMRALVDFTRKRQGASGSIGGNQETTATTFAAMGFAEAARAIGSMSDAALFKAVDFVSSMQQKDGAMPDVSGEPPIQQGQFMVTGNALVAFEWAAAHAKDPKYRHAADRALAWIAANDPVATQDSVFKIVALNRFGSADQKRAAWPLVEVLVAEQQPDGGWKEVPSLDGSNAFATGQVLYAFKRAGVSVRSDTFRRGVEYLLKTQQNEPTPDNGSWKPVHTQSQRKSTFAPTMWAVIGLAGAYGTESRGALQVVKQGEKLAAPNLEIVLDVSGSMKTKLGASTRWQTALDVMKELVATLPEDLNVGLRVYGHRYPSKSAQTCQDTELVVPIARLDRGRIVSTAAALQPRGETPLVRSVLKTVEDLKAAGGGSVILITDGEESCKGDAKAAARDIERSGVNVTLDIVGFTLTGKAVEAELGKFAGSTGGHYYGAQDGVQLARAVRLAALRSLPYDVLEASGKVLASGQTSELSQELAPGSYRVRVQALGQVLEEAVTIVPEQTTVLRLGVEGDHFVARH